MSANSTMEVPNPYAQMAWVTPPRDARDLSVKLYAEAGAASILLWDILIHLPQDYKILRTHRINLLTVVFYFSRFASIIFVLGLTIVTTSPIGNCNLVRYVDFLYPLTVPLSVLPFVPRVSAIYHNNKYVLAFFTFTWLGVLGTSILWPFGVEGRKIGPTDYCSEIRSHSTASIAALVLLVHDTLIFLATSWAFVSHHSHTAHTAKGIFKVAVLGKNLPDFTKLVLRDGQAYYLASLVLHVMFLSQFYTTSPFAFPCSFGNPSLVLTTNMAAYVYRNIRLGFYKDHTVATSTWNRGITRPTSTATDRPQGVHVVFDKSTTPGFSSLEMSVDSRDGLQEKHAVTDCCPHVVEIGTGPFKELEVETKTDV